MTKESEIKEKLKAYALDLGFSLFGAADVRKVRDEFHFDEKLKTMFSWGVALGKRLVDSVLDDINDRPTSLYFHHYRQLNFFLDRGAFLLASHIQDLGYEALPVPASQIINWEKQQAHLSHKKIGQLAGLGWIGRNNLLVNPHLGARFRLVTVLTDMPLEPDQALQAGCGECCACLPACPARAVKEKRENFDHRACYDQLDEFKRLGIVSQHICGICVKACAGAGKK